MWLPRTQVTATVCLSPALTPVPPPAATPADVHTYLPWSTKQDNHLLELAEQYTQVSSSVQTSTRLKHTGCWVRLADVPGPLEARILAECVCSAAALPCPALNLPPPQGSRIKWSAVAAQLPGRTDKQCAIRWKTLTTG